MSRYIREEVLNQPEDFVNFMMNDFLTKHGFQYKEFKGQMVYRSGNGAFEMAKFFVWNYQNDVIHVEAWMRNVWLSDVYGRENGLSGYAGIVPKNAYKRDIEQLMQLLHQPAGAFGAESGAQPGGNDTVMVHGVDTVRYANMSLAFGILGLVFFCVPYAGLLWGILALIYSNKGRTSSKSGRAVAGLVCGVVAILIAAAMLILNIVGITTMIGEGIE